MRRILALLAALLTLVALPAGATEDQASLGGGTDISGATVVRIPQGGHLPPLHWIFAENPERRAVEVEFRAEAATGILVEPEWEKRRVEPGERVENRFGIRVLAAAPSGTYPVVVQLVRTDIEAEPGAVTHLPAIEAAFTVEVTGEAATVQVVAQSGLTGAPVEGTVVLEAMIPGGGPFEMGRAEGGELAARVAPGSYRASFRLGDRVLASEEVEVEAGDDLRVVLEVETVSFVTAAVRTTEEDGRPVVVDLVAALNNEAEQLEGPLQLQAVVSHQGREVETVLIDEFDELPLGISEASATYRPAEGWLQGTYTFRFELVASSFTLVASSQPSVEVPPPPSNLDWRMLAAVAAAALLVVVLLLEAVRRLRRPPRRGKGMLEPVAEEMHRREPAEPQAEAASPAQIAEPPVAVETELAAPPPPRDLARLTGSMELVQRLRETGKLGPGWSVWDAAAVYWALTSPQLRESLAALGMDEEKTKTVLSRLFRGGLLAPAPGRGDLRA